MKCFFLHGETVLMPGSRGSVSCFLSAVKHDYSAAFGFLYMYLTKI